MATATKLTARVPVVTTAYTDEVSITLKLSLAEAETLRYLTGSCMGSILYSRNKHTYGILVALLTAGVDRPNKGLPSEGNPLAFPHDPNI